MLQQQNIESEVMNTFTVGEVRRAKGFSQKALADAIGISHVTYQRREDNPEEFTLKDVRRISDTLGVPSSEIIFLPNMTIICS